MVIARFVLEKLNLKKVAFMTDVKQDYSVGLDQHRQRLPRQNGGTIVKEQSYSSGDKDFRAQLTDLKSANPDVIIITGYYPEVSLIAKQARQFGIKATFVGGDGWDGTSLISVGGKAIEGAFFSNHFSVEDKSPLVQTFVQKYKEKYNTVPDAFAALGYDAAKLLADAITRAGGRTRTNFGRPSRTPQNFPGSLRQDHHRQGSKCREVRGHHHHQRRSLQIRRNHRTEIRKLSVVSASCCQGRVVVRRPGAVLRF